MRPSPFFVFHGLFHKVRFLYKQLRKGRESKFNSIPPIQKREVLCLILRKELGAFYIYRKELGLSPVLLTQLLKAELGKSH